MLRRIPNKGIERTAQALDSCQASAAAHAYRVRPNGGTVSRGVWASVAGLSIAAALLGCASNQPKRPATVALPRGATATPTQGDATAPVPTPTTEVEQEPEPDAPLPAYLDSLPAHRVGRQPTNSEITAVVRKFAARQNSDVALARVGSIKVARDSLGRWWVSARAVPVKSMYDEATLYLYKQGRRWKLKAFGTNVDTSALPKDVRSQL